jgi:hypothetical protein
MTNKKHTIVRKEEDISPLDRQIINIMCHKCPFYAKDQEYWEREYECGAYKLVRQMIIEKLFSTIQIEDILINKMNKVDKV